MLASIGIAKNVQALIAKNPSKLAYSGLVSLLASKDPAIQLSLSQILVKLNCSVDHTDTIVKMLPYIAERKIISN